jgi:hypothetical protein
LMLPGAKVDLISPQVALAAPTGPLLAFADPQSLLLAPALVDGELHAAIACNPGHHMVLATAKAGALTQRVMFKLLVAPATSPPPPPTQATPGSTWQLFAQVRNAFNANVSNIYHPQGGYLHPRPATCSARVGSDGYSPWTFTYGQGNAPPFPALDRVPAMSVDGVLTTPQGVRFLDLFNASMNIAFASLWENFPAEVVVPTPHTTPPRCTSTVWVLVAGSTNPMQTGLANAALNFSFTGSAALGAANWSIVELTPPATFWSLSSIGGVDYNYARDAFCLPPTPPLQVQLGHECRAMLYAWQLPAGASLLSVGLTVLSSDVVIGIMGVSVEDTCP